MPFDIIRPPNSSALMLADAARKSTRVKGSQALDFIPLNFLPTRMLSYDQYPIPQREALYPKGTPQPGRSKSGSLAMLAAS